MFIILWIFKEKSGEKIILENSPLAQLGTLKMEEIRMVFQVLVRNWKVFPAEEYFALKYGQKCCWTLAGILDTGYNSHRVLGKMCPVRSGIPSSSFSFFSHLLPVEGTWIPYLWITLERWNKEALDYFPLPCSRSWKSAWQAETLRNSVPIPNPGISSLT